MTLETLRSSAAPRAMIHAPLGAFNPMIRGAQVAYSPDEGPLSISEAVGLLGAAPEQEEQAAEAAAPEGEPVAEAEEGEPLPEESEAEPTADETLDPETATEGEEVPEPESDPQPVIAAPKSWDATERATFAQLPPAAQEIILKRETERDRAVSRAQQEAGEARRSVETELAGLAQYKTVFDQVVTNAQKVFAGKWDNVDWVAYARQDPEAYLISKAEFDADSQELHRTQLAQVEATKVQEQAELVGFQNYIKAEFAKLPEIAPDLADPKDGAARRTKTAQFLLDSGYEAEAVRQMSALDMSVAYDAMRFRQGQTALKTAAKTPAQPKPIPTLAPARAAAPTAAAPARPQRQRTFEGAMDRLTRTGTVDAGVAALRAMRGA